MRRQTIPTRSYNYQTYRDSVADILKEAKPAAELQTRFPSQASLIHQAIESTGKTVAKLRYLPLLSRNDAWTVLLDAITAEPVGFIPLDSF